MDTGEEHALVRVGVDESVKVFENIKALFCSYC